MLDGIDSALYNATLLNKLIYNKSEQKIPIHSVTDINLLSSKSLCDVTKKHLWIDIGALKEAIENKDIEHISWVKTNEQLADSLTKSGVSSVPLVNFFCEEEFGPAVTAYLFIISKGLE